MCVLSHLTVVLLVRTVMRRAGVRPWTATATVLPLVFFGAGEENVVWGFQINFNLSLAFGLIQLLLADHDGRVNWRDSLAVLAGLAALMSSGIGVTMVVVVGLAVLVRRGWRVAALQTAPLGVAYLVWHFAIARDDLGTSQDFSGPLDALRFARTTIAAGFGGLAQVPGLGWALGGLIVGGLVPGLARPTLGPAEEGGGRPRRHGRWPFVFVLITASGRVGFAPGIERSTRYVHVFGVLLLPVVAIAADAVMRRWRAAVPVLAAFLVASLVGNVDDFSNERPYGGEFLAAYRTRMLAVRTLPLRRPGAPRPAARAEPGAVRIGGLAAGRCEVRPHPHAGRHPARGAGDDGGAGGPAGEPTGHEPNRCEAVTPARRSRCTPAAPPPAWPGPAVGRVHRCDGGRRTGPVPMAGRSHRRLRRAAHGERVLGPSGQPIELCDPEGLDR